MFLRTSAYVLLVFLFMALSCEEDSPTEPSTKGSIAGFVTNMDDETGLSKVNIFTEPATSSVTTTEDGSYQIKNVEEGTYKVTAAKAGYDTLSIDITVVGEKETIADFITKQLVVDKTKDYGFIIGRLTDKNTLSSIEGVNIKTLPSTSSVTTSVDGTFFLGNLSARSYSILATKVGYDSTSIDVNVSLGDTTIADIFMSVEDTSKIPTTGSIKGVVIDAITGLVIKDALVTTDPSTSVVNSDAEGQYRFTNLLPGKYSVLVNKVGYQSTESEILVVAGEETTANFSMIISSGSIQGSVTDAQTGAVLQGVIVTTNPGSSSVLTNSEGNYTIENLLPKSYTINAEKNGYVKSTVSITVSAGKATRVDIVMTKTP